jgi:hypothetical protein
VYVEVVVPSWAVTTALIVLVPTTNGIEVLADPEETLTPFTLSVAVESVTVGVIIMEAVSFETLAV